MVKRLFWLLVALGSLAACSSAALTDPTAQPGGWTSAAMQQPGGLFNHPSPADDPKPPAPSPQDAFTTANASTTGGMCKVGNLLTPCADETRFAPPAARLTPTAPRPTAAGQAALAPPTSNHPTAAAPVAPAFTPSPIGPGSNPQSTCSNRAEFVRHLSISDHTALMPLTAFGKVWRIRNVGDCTWNTSYSLVWQSGEDWRNPQQQYFTGETGPGQTLDIHLSLAAPLTPGDYLGQWLLQDAAGRLFGVGPTFDQPLTLSLVVRDPDGPKPFNYNCG